MTTTTASARRLPMSPGAGAALLVTAVLLGALGAGSLLLHGTQTAHTLISLSGALFGMGLVFALFRKVGLAGPRLTWRAFGLVLLALVVFAAGPYLASVYAPGNDLLAVAIGLLIAAVTLGAGIAAARIEATARADAQAAALAGVDDDPAAGDPGAGPDAGAYSAAEALADVAGSRAGLADVIPTPAWYHPVIALGLAIITIALGIDIPGVWLIALEIPAIALILGAIVAYRRSGAPWLTMAPRGTRAYRIAITLMITVFACLALSGIAHLTGLWWLAVLAGVAVFVAYVVIGRRHDDAFRADLRAGVTRIDEGAVR